MEIITIKQPEKWNTWAQNNGSSFLQSSEWGEVLMAEGKEVERLAVVEGGETIAQAQVVYSNLPLGIKYAFCPAGPVLECRMMNDECRMNDQIYKCLNDYLKSKNCIFFRYEPAQLANLKSKIKNLKSLDITPRATTILDLTKSEEDLLAAMHEKTRYNIRLAQKKDLSVIDDKNFEVFLELMKQTGVRDKFRLHDDAHYRAILLSPLSYQITVGLRTPDKGSAIATAIFSGFGDTFTYLFGASNHELRSLMAPYLIQLDGIRLAKKLGFKKYDFFGITPPSEANAVGHQYAGVTRFKLGFGGETHENPGTYDLIISPIKYKIYEALRKIRRII